MHAVAGLANLGYVYGAVGRRAQAYEVLAELHELSRHRYVPHHMSALGTLPLFDGVRADARFKSLLHRIGLPARLGDPSPAE